MVNTEITVTTVNMAGASNDGPVDASTATMATVATTAAGRQLGTAKMHPQSVYFRVTKTKVRLKVWPAKESGWWCYGLNAGPNHECSHSGRVEAANLAGAVQAIVIYCNRHNSWDWNATADDLLAQL